MSKFKEIAARTSVERGPSMEGGASGGREASMRLADVARDLLGLEPAALGKMDPRLSDDDGMRQGDPSRGLSVLVRRAMGLALALRDEEGAVVRLMSDGAARADLWPDARTANTAMVVAWALVNDLREAKGLATVPLTSTADRPDGRRRSAIRTGSVELATGLDLFEAFGRPTLKLEDLASAPRDPLIAPLRARLDGAPVASTNAAIREVLGLEPRELADMVDRRRHKKPGASFEADPEAAGREGLLQLLRDAFVQFDVMRTREVDGIRLLSDAEAREEGWNDSRAARFSTLVAAALLHGDPRDVVFLPARDPRPEREDLLLAMARDLYFHGSEIAFQEFEMICDDDVGFGVDRGHDKARRLLWRVSKEHDPHGTRLRELPDAIADALILVEAADSSGR